MGIQAQVGPTTAGTGNSGSDDPAAEWLYLLLCRFVQERVLSNLYDNVGIRAGGRRSGEGRNEGSAEVAEAQWRGGEASGARRHLQRTGDKAAGGGNGTAAPVLTGVSEREEAAGDDGGRGRGEGEEKQEEEQEEDFFFSVTPEQLIVLNLAEIVAGTKSSATLSCDLPWASKVLRCTLRPGVELQAASRGRASGLL